ncbi:MAG: hypothetical protein QXV54_02895 [Desulfurococcaceae archaeon]
MVKHILIDILEENTLVESSVINKLIEKCREIFKEDIDSHEIKLYYCNKGVAYVQKRNSMLLVDLIDSEEVFDAILGVLPRENLMIRLVERGAPEN